MMTSKLHLIIYAIVLFCQGAIAQDVREETVHFQKGDSGITIMESVTGNQTVNYKLRADAGQTIAVALASNNVSAYFNIFEPGKSPGDTAMFISSINTNHYTGELPVAGIYTIQVYLFRNAARSNEKADYSLEISIDGETKKTESSALFDKTYQLQGIEFRVISESKGSINTLNIIPSGLEIDNSPIIREIDGSVIGTEVADLNSDGSPEIYVYVISAGSGSYGELIAYSTNKKKSLSEIYLPPITDSKSLSAGYMGHDEFTVLENVLGHRFPIYLDSDTNANPTGGMRQIQYKLFPGEAGWILKVNKVIQF